MAEISDPSGSTATYETQKLEFDDLSTMISESNTSFSLTVEKLHGKNYHEWAQSIKLVVDGKGKLGYLTGGIAKPASTNAAASQKWQSENSMVTAWLINSMVPSIKTTYMYLPTAKDVWDAVCGTYSDAENSCQIFEIKTQQWQMKQGNQDVTEYYTEMLALWQELDLSTEQKWDCAGYSVRFKCQLEDERVFAFLARLNMNLMMSVVGSWVAHLFHLQEKFLRRSDVRKITDKVMLKEHGQSGLPTTGSDMSALVSKGSATSSTGSNVSALASKGPGAVLGPKQQQGRSWCEHYRKIGHTKDTCWEIHGKLANWKPRQNNKHRGYQAAVQNSTDKVQESKNNAPTSNGFFNSAQLDQLYKIFSKLQASESSSASLSGI